MEENFDNELYNKYLNGDMKAFEKLYSKYKSKILYFINNIVKDYEKAEDITQDVFIYLIQNKMKEEYSFKYYIYLIAKSRAVSYLNQTKRRNDITEKYLNFKENDLEENLDEIIVQEENKKEVLEAIENLDEKYKNAIYLVNIEGLSYKEVSRILGLTLSNTKVLVHRGKKELKKILLKKGFKEMRKISRISIIVICILIGLSGVTFGAITIYNNFIKKQDSFETNGLYSDGRGYTNYETDLTANDMEWQSNVNLYYRVITNVDDYNKYKNRVSEFPDSSDINFDESFVIVIANENPREYDEIDMEISNVYLEDNTTHVIMKQKENPDMESRNNVWYAIVDKSQLAENVYITIEHEEFNNSDYVSISDLPADYSMESAINDGCFTLDNNRVVSDNPNALDEFIEKTENGEEAFIRIYSKFNDKISGDEIIIHDINYSDGIYYDYSGAPGTEKDLLYYNTSKELRKTILKNGEHEDIHYDFYKHNEFDENYVLIIIQNWVTDEFINNQ